MNLHAFSRAADFVWHHARLLDRLRFGHAFEGRSAAGVVAAVMAYRNDDGGFGQALEADCRTPHSQPEATRWGLAALAEVDELTPERAAPSVSWLASVAHPDGGVPFCLPTVDGYPRAPWWQPADPPNTPSINPTGAVVGLLRAAGVGHEWLDRAETWCVSEAERVLDAGPTKYDTSCLVALAVGLGGPRGDALLDRLAPVVRAEAEAILGGNVEEDNDPHTPVDLAPSPDHSLAQRLGRDIVDPFLDRLEASQQDDGGWPVAWPAPGTTALAEWRAVKTVNALRALSAYGRLAD